jgi:hypothetical protein
MIEPANPSASATMSCTDCGAPAPETSTPYTLISAGGWRLVFEYSGERRFPRWRCPTCWQRFKSTR